MSIYRCGCCDGLKDADFDGCYQHPIDECDCICERCNDEQIHRHLERLSTEIYYGPYIANN